MRDGPAERALGHGALDVDVDPLVITGGGGDHERFLPAQRLASRVGGVSNVSSLIDDLGPTLVVATTGDLSPEITSVVLTDPAFPARLDRGSLVLAAGYRLDSEDLLELCERARDVGAAAIVVKGSRWSLSRALPSGPSSRR